MIKDAEKLYVFGGGTVEGGGGGASKGPPTMTTGLNMGDQKKGERLGNRQWGMLAEPN